MARRAADVYHRIQSHPAAPHPRLSTKPIIIKVKTVHPSNFGSSLLLPLLLLATLFRLIDFGVNKSRDPTNCVIFLFQVISLVCCDIILWSKMSVSGAKTYVYQYRIDIVNRVDKARGGGVVLLGVEKYETE